MGGLWTVLYCLPAKYLRIVCSWKFRYTIISIRFISFTLSLINNLILKGWTGGDPNILTYDALNFAFNGNGEYILSKANDGSFMVQAHTKIITNTANPSIKGTVFRGFALKTTASSTIQIELDDSTSTPDLGIFAFNFEILFLTLNLFLYSL